MISNLGLGVRHYWANPANSYVPIKAVFDYSWNSGLNRWNDLP